MHGGYVPRVTDHEYLSRVPGGDGLLFFLSYAHSLRNDHEDRYPNPWITQLYDDLCDHIKALADLPPGHKAGFMDHELRQGHEWPERLSEALATCRVLAPTTQASRRYATGGCRTATWKPSPP
jgi:hypothetical protein